jgi:hypothetical protein
MRLRFLAPAALALAAALTPTNDARACGGCFPPVIQQGGSTVVTGHRMALSVSTTQTVLWDQIEYTGDPEEFGWVLPVKPGAVLELSTDAWFETLDAATVATVQSPVISCPAPPGTVRGGCGFAAAAGFSDESGAGGGDGQRSDVTVVHQGTVGPYETVTLETDKPGALNTWLTDHAYNIDADVQPIVDAYVAEGFQFIALRLQPGKGVRAMKPVRVVTPGASMTLPLRMVAAGTGAEVSVVLFTITEGRLMADKYANKEIEKSLLAWDFATESSNFTQIRKNTLAGNAGFTWLTTYAYQGALTSPVPHLGGYSNFGYTDDYSYIDTIAGAYFNQGALNKEVDTSCANALMATQSFTEDQVVVDPCPAGVPPGDPSCDVLLPGEVAASDLTCGALDDLGRALIGLHPGDVWLTRLEANLPRLALEEDLVLTPSTTQTNVDNVLHAPIALNTDNLCPNVGPITNGIVPPGPGTGSNPDRTTAALVAALALAAASAVGRRVVRRRIPRHAPAR